MNRTAHELLSEIRLHAGKNISNSDLEVILAEVQAHLDASIQARMELGISFRDAEIQAVRAFGDGNAFAKLPKKSCGKRDRQVFAITALSVLSVILAVAYLSSIVEVLSVVILPMACLMLALIGYRSRRLAWRPSGLSLLATIPFAAVLLSGTHVPSGLLAIDSRSDAVARMERRAKRMEIERSIEAKFSLQSQQAAAVLQSSASAAPYHVPSLFHTGVIRDRTFDSKEQATNSLLSETSRVAESYEITYASYEAARANSLARLGRPLLLNAVFLVPFTAAMSLLVVAFLVAANVLGVTLALAVRAIRIMKRRALA